MLFYLILSYTFPMSAGRATQIKSQRIWPT